MNNTLLTFTSQFNLSNTPADLTLIDTTAWVAQGIALSQVAGIFTLKSSVGTFHANLNYASPDITRNLTDTFIHLLPLDSNGVVIAGDYELTYNVKVTAEAKSIALIGVSPSAQTFRIAGNYIAEILNATGGTIQITDCPNAGTYTIDPTITSYDSINNITIIGVTTVPPSPLYSGGLVNYTVDCYYTTTNTISFCITVPNVEIEVTSECSTSTIISKDVTDYTAIYAGTSLTPTVITRTHTVKYPSAMNPVHADVVSSLDTITITPIWTKTWVVIVSTALIYVLPDGTTLSMTVEGSLDHDVECESGLCCASQCIYNIYNNYLIALGNNPAQAQIYRELLIKVMGCWMSYSIFTNCGSTSLAQEALAKLIALVKSANCDCCTNSDSLMPVQIVPLIGNGGGSGTTTIVTTCGNGITVSSSTIGTVTTYTVCLDTSVITSMITNVIAAQKLFDHDDTIQLALVNGQVLMYNSSTNVWNNILLGLGNLSNVDLITNVPANGYVFTWNNITGKAEFLPSQFHNLLVNSVSDVGNDANNLEKTLKNYVMPALPPTMANGDCIVVEALFTNNQSGRVIYGQKLYAKIYFGLVPSLITQIDCRYPVIKYELKITKLTSSTYFYEYMIIGQGQPSSVAGILKGSGSEIFSNPLNIRCTGQSTVTATANLIVCNYLRVYINHV